MYGSLVAVRYLKARGGALLNLTGVDMGAWQRAAGKWAIGTFLIFLASMYLFGGVPLSR